MRSIRAAAIVVALVAGILGFGTTPAQAAVFNVTTTEYKYDGVCDDDCSLLDAVYTANGLPGAHTVFVPTGVYPVTGGPLTIWSNVTIQSVGGQVTLDAQRTGRVVKINKAGNATFKGFLITNGKTTDGGAGVLNEGTLSLVDSVVNASVSSISCGAGLLNLGTAYVTGSAVSGNTAPNGAGICNGHTSTLTLTSTDVGFNQSTGDGAGIYNTGRVSLRNTEVGNNTAQGNGGGILNGGILTVSDSLVVQNDAGDGGGVYNYETAEVTSSRFIDNTAGSGGGIANRFKLDLVDSTLSGNSALFGGGISNSSILNVVSSTFADNAATGFDGGGLSNYANAATAVANSTFSGNTAGNDGGGVHQSSSNLLTIVSSTIVGNVADDDTSNGGRGGGIFVSGGGVSLRNSIVSTNQNPGALSSPDCFGALTSTGFNIIGDLDGCGVTLLESDGTGVPKFGPLADNGGPTPTHSLVGKLGAIDHGPKGAACTGTDQRGVPRQSPCDTGAYELVTCGTIPVSIVGTGQSDTIKGTGKADGILALGGADRVKSGSGNDQICGGGGADELTGGKGNDLLNGGSGRDRCSGGPGKTTYRRCEAKR